MCIMKRNVANFKYAHAIRAGAVGEGGSAGRLCWPLQLEEGISYLGNEDNARERWVLT